jgi:uncharacterized membrane protein HdeD (DUF308 family)
MAKRMNMKMDDHWQMHKKRMGCKMLVLGVLVLANSYWGIVSWTNFIGGILVIAGLVKLVGHPCKCK